MKNGRNGSGSMTVKRTSIFPAKRETVFGLLKRLETLQYIARPFAAFEPLDDADTTWAPGSVSSYYFRLFCFIPFGAHTIRILRFDPDMVSSREGNRHVPVWNHDIILRPLDGGRTEYTDRVEIRAGWKTPFVWLWAQAFYAHRQRKWIRLLKERRT